MDLQPTNAGKNNWVIVNREGQILGLDVDSGGYPWIPSSISGWHFWESAERAEQYMKSFGEGTAYAEMVKAPLSVMKFSTVVLHALR